ncbi:sigma-70 family RNA polymerase sigma factor [Maioricimonas sp. JC845]|uniref:RNA polymerase sigma factor n=1 Tax=Maioricimonas sp. JC845 TaxID=3232138 RepID=UPI003457B77C
MTDEVVDVQLLRMGDRDAWDALYAATCRRTYRVLYHLTAAKQSVLEELNQDVWLSAIQSIDRFDATRGTAADWILGIARHKGLTFLRRQYASRVVCVGGSGDLPEPTATVDDDHDAVERAALLRAAIESLPENWQYVLRQKYQSGRSVREIADLMDATPKSVESILSRARQRLRDLLREPTSP